jgi:DNA-binding HxlR family transcriptional regulator
MRKLLVSRSPAARIVPELQAAGLVSRRVDPGPPITAVYSLTAEGERLSPLFDNIWSFAEELSRTAAEPTDS